MCFASSPLKTLIFVVVVIVVIFHLSMEILLVLSPGSEPIKIISLGHVFLGGSVKMERETESLQLTRDTNFHLILREWLFLGLI